MLTRAEIDDILKLIDGSDFTELKLEMGDLKLELRKGPQAAALPLHLGQNTPRGARDLAQIPRGGREAPLRHTRRKLPAKGTAPANVLDIVPYFRMLRCIRSSRASGSSLPMTIS